MTPDEDFMRFNMLDKVTHQDLGWWLTRVDDNEMQYTLNLIVLATTLGWTGIDQSDITANAAYLLSDEVSAQDIEDYNIIAEDAVGWMNETLEETDFAFKHYPVGIRLETVRFIAGGSPTKEKSYDFALDA